MFDLTKFPLQEMTKCGATLRTMGDGAGFMDVAANRMVRYLYDNLGDPTERACPLVRFYKTHALGKLPADLQTFAKQLLPQAEAGPETKCLTLLATAGQAPEWNSRKASQGHKAIPLASESVVAQLPMVAQLVRQFGLAVNDVLMPRPEMIVDLDQRQFNVFLVSDAKGSPFIPAQDTFVVPYGIQSVLGFGGMLPSGDLFAVILFARAVISRQVAESFRTISLTVKMAILGFGPERIFQP
jgi:hypothetical protein